MSELFALLIGHAFADYALQNDFVAKFKSRHMDTSMFGGQKVWIWVLSSHALMHGGVVWVITNNVWLGLAETVAHFIIDFSKCEKWIDFHQDQIAHIACKILWSVL